MENSHTYTISDLIGAIEHHSIPTYYLVTKKGAGNIIGDIDSIEEYYENLFLKFQSLLNTLKINKYDAIMISTYLSDAKVAKAILEEKLKVFTYNDNSLRNSLSSNENKSYCYYKLDFSVKIETLNLIINSLDGELSFLNFASSDESKKELPVLNTKSNQVINDSGRATFNLSKKESIMLIHVFEKTNLLKFESDEQLSKFIESNFSFTEIRANADKGKALPMKDVRSEISKLRGGQHSESNNKILEKLLNKLNETIHLFEF
ncbi:hypothetical protein [Flavobacterium ovatum]|uniref:hypothetical protein n=1 Tax=Flavobacterium ovatum TaxID=1928857 RepID=UPI00344B3844